MAFSWDSWEVGALSPGATFDPFPLFPLAPPLFPPFPPVTVWELPGELDPEAGEPFPWLSPLNERLRPCFPKVRGGGGFSVAWLEPFPLLFPATFAPPRPALAPVSPDSPTGFWAEGVVDVLLLPLGPEETSLEVAGRDGFVLAPNAAQPVRPLLEEEAPLLVGFANVAGACRKSERVKEYSNQCHSGLQFLILIWNYSKDSMKSVIPYFTCRQETFICCSFLNTLSCVTTRNNKLWKVSNLWRWIWDWLNS